MSNETERNGFPAGDGVDRRRFLKFGSTVAGAGLGSMPVAAGDEESEPEGEMGPKPDGDLDAQDVTTVSPDEEISQTWYFTIYCPGWYCEPGPFAVTGLTKVEHVDSGSVLHFDEKSWYQGYETVARTWDLGTPNEWAEQLDLDSPSGRWDVHGEMWVDGQLSATATVPIEVEDDCPLEELVSAKRDRIGEIRDTAAGFGYDRGTVDQTAEAILDDVTEDGEDCVETDDDSEREQIEEALERMLAAEEVTQTATEAGAGDGPVSRVVDALFRLAQTASVKLLEKVGGKLLRKVANRLVTFASSKTTTLLDTLSGRGVLSNEKYDRIVGTINRLETLSYYRFKALKEGDYSDDIPDDADPVGTLYEDFANEGASAMNATAEQLGVHDHLETDLVGEIRNTLEEQVFDAYYSGNVQEIHVPAPEEIEIPDLDVTVDLPNEDLPFGLGHLVPDTIEVSMETPDVPLPEVPVLTDVHGVRNGIATPIGSTRGVNDSLESSMGSLSNRIFDVDQQNESARNHVRDVMAGGIDAVNDTAESAIDAVETLREKVGEAQDKIGTLITIMLAGGVLAIVTGVGAIGLVAAAVKLTTITTAMLLFNAFLDVFAIVVGVGTTLYFANLHHVGVTGILEDDLGGVSSG